MLRFAVDPDFASDLMPAYHAFEYLSPVILQLVGMGTASSQPHPTTTLGAVQSVVHAVSSCAGHRQLWHGHFNPTSVHGCLEPMPVERVGYALPV